MQKICATKIERRVYTTSILFIKHNHTETKVKLVKNISRHKINLFISTLILFMSNLGPSIYAFKIQSTVQGPIYT